MSIFYTFCMYGRNPKQYTRIAWWKGISLYMPKCLDLKLSFTNEIGSQKVYTKMMASKVANGVDRGERWLKGLGEEGTGKSFNGY